jgi:hypothetical protein
MTASASSSDSTFAGVWIDHHDAFIVFMPHEAAGELAPTIPQQGSPHHVRFTGGQNGAHHGAEDQRDMQFKVHLNQYYDAVIAGLTPAARIVLLGPGEAKGELKKRLDALPLTVHQGSTTESRIVAVQNADHMTHPQLYARVHAFYAERARGTAQL